MTRGAAPQGCPCKTWAVPLTPNPGPAPRLLSSCFEWFLQSSVGDVTRPRRPAKKVKAADSGKNPGKPPPFCCPGMGGLLDVGVFVTSLKVSLCPSGKKYRLTEKLVFLSCFNQINLDGRKRVPTVWGRGGEMDVDGNPQKTGQTSAKTAYPCGRRQPCHSGFFSITFFFSFLKVLKRACNMEFK